MYTQVVLLFHSFAQPPGSNIFYYGITKYNSGTSIASILMVVVAAIVAFSVAAAVFSSTAIFNAFVVCVSFCLEFIVAAIY